MVHMFAAGQLVAEWAQLLDEELTDGGKVLDVSAKIRAVT